MENKYEKCQLMREIYKETDIEPAMWHDYNPDFGTLYDAWTAKQKTVMGAQVHETGENFEFAIEFYQPWYPLEQVLKHLTPDVQNTVLMHHDYHLTALKLWKQTLEEKLCMNK